MIRFYSFAAALLTALCLPACSSMAGSDTNPDTPGADPLPVIESFTAASSVVFVGASTQLTAVFTGDSASVDLIGPVQSGIAIETPHLSRTTTFTLTVQQG